MLADVLPRNHEDDVLGDVRRVVAKALQVARNQDQTKCWLDGRRILQHEGQWLPENLDLQCVERVVRVQDLLGKLHVWPHEGVQGISGNAPVPRRAACAPPAPIDTRRIVMRQAYAAKITGLCPTCYNDV